MSTRCGASIDRARAVRIEDECTRRGIKLKGQIERTGPCPVCGGHDRFAINTKKQVWNCRGCSKGGDVISLVQHIDACDFDQAVTTLAGEPPKKSNGRGNGKSRYVGTWIYHDADGNPYLKVERFDKPDGTKVYPQYHWNGTRWIKGKPEGPKIPYRLPELLDSDRTEPVYIFEGEKCADAAAKLGLAATSASEGAGKWTSDLNERFRDRIAYIVLDNDEPGAKHADHIAANLAGVAREVRIVTLPGLAHKEDVVDWIERGGTREQLDVLGDAAPKWSPPSEGQPNNETADDQAVLDRLAKLSPIEYDRARVAAAKQLGVRAPILDRLVEAGREKGGGDDGKQGRPLNLPAPQPWPDPIVGAELLAETVEAITRYMVLPDGAAETTALWAVHTHCFDYFAHSPRLAITSPEKGCGKTLLLDILASLVARPIPTSNATVSAIFRAVETAHPTLLIDEADTFLRDDDELRGILNAGHRKGGMVLRTVGDDHEPRQFSAWAPAAIAMIGQLPDTLHDRSVNCRLDRRKPSEVVQSFRSDRADHMHVLARKMARWAADNEARLSAADPDMGDLQNRVADNWRPVFAMADLAGGTWPARVREIASAAAAARSDESNRTLLLADVRDLFANRDADRLPSEEIIAHLNALEDRPWPEWKSKPLTKAGLARLLKPLGIEPANIRLPDGRVPKGYLRSTFADAFGRYLPL